MASKNLYDASDWVLCGTASVAFTPFTLWAYLENDMRSCYALIACHIFFLSVFLLTPIVINKIIFRHR